MEVKEAMKRCMSTCMPSCDNFIYMFMNFISEIGEFSGKIAKANRASKLFMKYEQLDTLAMSEKEEKDFERLLKLEWFDALWQWFGVCHVQGWDPEEILEMGLEKLAKRKKENKIEGDGDER